MRFEVRMRLGWWRCVWLVPIAVGCGADAPQASLRLLSPAPDQVLTLADDTDDLRVNLQFPVRGDAREVDENTAVFLYIDDDQRAQSATVDSTGKIDFGDVTLPPGEHLIHLETGTGSSTSDRDQQYTFKALLIRSPEDQARFSSTDDEDPSKDELQVSVKVEAFALGGDEVSLLLDDEAVGSVTPDAQGMAGFADLTLRAGSHRLRAQSGSGDERIESPEITVEVHQGSCAVVSFVSPQPLLLGDSIRVGGPELCLADAPFLYTVKLSTDASRGQPARLFVNDLPAGETTVAASSTIEFKDIELPRRGDPPNVLRVEVESDEGVVCSVTFPASVYVDCEAPSCAITKPVPVTYVDANMQSTAYLNAKMRGRRGFDVEVETELALDHRDVQLLIDGSTTDVREAPPLAVGRKAIAVFEGVDLAEGEHTIEALCTDASGNISSSGEQTWTVDTSPCAIMISDPVDATRFVPADDEDGASAGTQVVITTAVTGSDCVAQRSRACDPAVGIDAGEFLQYEGASPLLCTTRLDDTVSDQQLCVEVQDRAGNSALGSVAVTYLHDAPLLAIESPLDGDEYNILGNAGFSADAEPATPNVCEAAFSIACGELGAAVELHLGAGDGPLLASSPCEAPGRRDPALPPGYRGRAQLIAPFDVGDGSGTVFATQAITAASTKTLVGTSAAVSLVGDCAAPAPTLVDDPCELGADGLLVVNPPATTTITQDVTAHTTDGDLTNLALAISNSDSTSNLIDSPDQPAPGDHVWSDVLLGGIGSVTITAAARDEFANVGQASCTAQITADPPSLSMIMPTSGAAFGPRAAYTDTCNTSITGEYGIQWRATVDKAGQRTLSLYLDGVLVQDDVPIVGTAASACVAVPDDASTALGQPSTLTARVATTSQGQAYVDYPIAVSVHTVEITDPTDGQVLQAADDCLAGSGFGYMVHADVDVMHHNVGFMLSGGSGTPVQGTVSALDVSGCVPLAPGQQMIRATIASSPASDTISVQVP